MNKWIWSVASGRHKFSVKDYFQFLIITLHCHPTKDRPKLRRKERKSVTRDTYLMISGLLNSSLKIFLSVLDETYVTKSFLLITNPFWVNWTSDVASGRHKFSVKDYFQYLIITLHCQRTKYPPKLRRKERKSVNRDTYLMISDLF